MFDFLNISTAYFLAGLVHMISPLVAWTSLHHLRERSITFWLIGTEVFSTGLLLLATRQLTPNWVSFELGNSLLAAGLLLQVHGLSLLTRVQYKQSLMISVGLIHILGYTLAHQLLPQQPTFFILALLFMAAEMGWICLLAFKLSNTCWFISKTEPDRRSFTTKFEPRSTYPANFVGRGVQE
jgi:hypothetical protein